MPKKPAKKVTHNASKKHPGGRPKKTLDDLPSDWRETVIKMSMDGCSECEIRAALTVRGGKFYHQLWDALEKREEEFSSTLKKAKKLCQAWWEKQGRINLKEKDFNHVLWYMNMKNRFSDEWKDKQEHEHKGDLIIRYGHRGK